MTAALLQSTSLPFSVTATGIDVAVGAISALTAAALLSAGLSSVVPFPPLAPTRLRRPNSAVDGVDETDPFAHRPMGTQD